MATMPRAQAIVLPILREALASKALKVGSSTEDVDYRVFPMVNVRRVGGGRNAQRPEQLSNPIIELTAFSAESQIAAEELWDDALEALYRACKTQKLTPQGYLHSVAENVGCSEIDSPFPDTYAAFGLIRLGTRPLRKPLTP